MQLINGQALPPSSSSGPKDSEDHTQQVLRPAPDAGRRLPGLEGGPQPA
jgi:hypothetical protein